MTMVEVTALKNRLLRIHKRAETIEAEVCELLNELAAHLIPATSELTDEAAHQLKNMRFTNLTNAVEALQEIIAEMEGAK